MQLIDMPVGVGEQAAPFVEVGENGVWHMRAGMGDADDERAGAVTDFDGDHVARSSSSSIWPRTKPGRSTTASRRAIGHEAGRRVERRRHEAVLFDAGDVRAQPVDHALQGCARRQWRAELDALRGADRLHADDRGEIGRHPSQTHGGMGGHRDMVLLIGRCRRRIGRARVGEMLVLAHQRRRRHLRDHQAGVEAGLRRQERRQVVAERRVDHQGDAALRDGADLGQRERDLVGGEGDRLGVEIAARDDPALVDENERIVGHGVGLHFERAAGKMKKVHRGADDLGLAADAIGVLHALVAFAVRFADFRAVEERALGSGEGDLPAMAAQGVDGVEKRRRRAHDRIGRERARHDARGRAAPRLEERAERDGGRELRAVEKGEPFLRAEDDGREPRTRQRLGGRAGARRRQRPRLRRS